MLAAGLAQCCWLGPHRVLLTCDTDNQPSRRVILANGGIPDGQRNGEDRFWINVGRDHRSSFRRTKVNAQICRFCVPKADERWAAVTTHIGGSRARLSLSGRPRSAFSVKRGRAVRRQGERCERSAFLGVCGAYSDAAIRRSGTVAADATSARSRCGRPSRRWRRIG
jgi:hypothetical protein